jgi:WD40 repeat protein
MNMAFLIQYFPLGKFQLIAGSDNGSLKLYDIQHTTPRTMGIYNSPGFVTFDEFDQLTSVHVNSTDELFLASGYSRNVALYDISCGRRLEVFSDMHREHINVVKFANYSPSVFVTSSFDQDVKMWDLRQKPVSPCYTASSSRGNVMVCFSPDDHYLLVSAVDNEVISGLIYSMSWGCQFACMFLNIQLMLRSHPRGLVPSSQTLNDDWSRHNIVCLI